LTFAHRNSKSQFLIFFLFTIIEESSNSRVQNSMTSSIAITSYLIEIGEFNPCHPSSWMG